MDVRGANTFFFRNRLPKPNLDCDTDSLSFPSASRALIFLRVLSTISLRLSDRGTQIKCGGKSSDLSFKEVPVLAIMFNPGGNSWRLF